MLETKRKAQKNNTRSSSINGGIYYVFSTSVFAFWLSRRMATTEQKKTQWKQQSAKEWDSTIATKKKEFAKRSDLFYLLFFLHLSLLTTLSHFYFRFPICFRFLFVVRDTSISLSSLLSSMTIVKLIRAYLICINFPNSWYSNFTSLPHSLLRIHTQMLSYFTDIPSRWWP